ncbi:MAG: hypothetical protein EOO50_08670 [Flavobacterium sp.]|uniref:hypothetical protein n=1 Tax=Flavobacterium sp. TaxID=239 RepID=UPI0012269175|nr:hypothetical protein [Flavobacterium sp.]RZJ66756.1 MAG: hypothetical protein EOO50_08670 [Flavobacterium sp.]
MKAQNLILKCNGSKIPNDKELREFVFEQLDNPNVDYCGAPTTVSDADKNALLLNFHFQTAHEVSEEAALEIITWAFYKRQIEKIRTRKKGIDIFLS